MNKNDLSLICEFIFEKPLKTFLNGLKSYEFRVIKLKLLISAVIDFPLKSSGMAVAVGLMPDHFANAVWKVYLFIKYLTLLNFKNQQRTHTLMTDRFYSL